MDVLFANSKRVRNVKRELQYILRRHAGNMYLDLVFLFTLLNFHFEIHKNMEIVLPVMLGTLAQLASYGFTKLTYSDLFQ